MLLITSSEGDCFNLVNLLEPFSSNSIFFGERHKQ